MNWLEKKTLGLFVKTKGVTSKPLFGGIGHVFMLHRVLPEKERNQYEINRDLAITPTALEGFINYFISLDYEFISLDELHYILQLGRKPKKKFVCFTLDDGYKDNLTYGFPIFSKYHVPFAIYITNSFPNNTAILWWYMLEKTIQNNNSIELETVHGIKKFSWKNKSEGTSQYYNLRQEIRKIPKPQFKRILLNAFGVNETELQNQNKQLFLSWEEIRQLSNENLATIGAHTMNHLSLKSLTEQELVDEIFASRQEIQKNTGREITHFAYPYGGFEDASYREYDVVKKLGFKTGTLNHPGNIFTSHKNYLERLPRMALGNSVSKEKLDYMLNGITHFSYNGFKKTVR